MSRVALNELVCRVYVNAAYEKFTGGKKYLFTGGVDGLLTRP